MSREQANLFFQVVAQRYERGSMILTSNLTRGSWHSAFAGYSVLAVGMLDRITPHRQHPPRELQDNRRKAGLLAAPVKIGRR
jgi:DNA replication protein DnaC